MEQHHFIYLISGTNRPSSNTLRIAQNSGAALQGGGSRSGIFQSGISAAGLFAPAAYRVKPPAFVTIQEKVLASAGLHLVVPEPNGSFPGTSNTSSYMLKFPESFERQAGRLCRRCQRGMGRVRAVEQLQMVFGYRNALPFIQIDSCFIGEGQAGRGGESQGCSNQRPACPAGTRLRSICGLFVGNRPGLKSRGKGPVMVDDAPISQPLFERRSVD